MFKAPVLSFKKRYFNLQFIILLNARDVFPIQVNVSTMKIKNKIQTCLGAKTDDKVFKDLLIN